MSIPHRLNAGNRFERPETQSIKRVVFLSVEGEVTERRYFEFVRESRETLGIKSVVEIHVLRRGDSSSSPEKVVELLENYLEVRNNNDFLAEVDKLELKHYDKEFHFKNKLIFLSSSSLESKSKIEYTNNFLRPSPEVGYRESSASCLM